MTVIDRVSAAGEVTPVDDGVIGTRVHVIEPGRVPWTGTVLAADRGLRSWYLRVRRDDGYVRSVPMYSVY